MIQTTKTKVIFSRKTWDYLKSDDYYREVIEAIEDREDLLKAIEENETNKEIVIYSIDNRKDVYKKR